MFIQVGLYRFKPKRVAFRNDFCLSCDMPRRSVKIRTFDMLQIFWIPVLPIGYLSRWVCTVCRRPPHVSRRTRRPFLWAGLIVLFIFALGLWIAPINLDFIWGTWIFRVCSLVGIILLLVYLLRTPSPPTLKQQLSAIPPASDVECPFCGTTLMVTSLQASCPTCGVVRS